MRKLRNVLSLFDGMSCGQIALVEEGFTFDTYFASEIDKNAIAHTQLNFPNTVQLGDVEKWRDWDIDWASIDLILAGSPCQGFTFAGYQKAFDDPRSKLFWRFVEVLEHVRKHNPDVKFLLENVKMRDQFMLTISRAVGVRPVCINSSLVSAQERERYYWSNIRTTPMGFGGVMVTDIPQPIDRCLVVADVLENVDRSVHPADAWMLLAPFKEVQGRRYYISRRSEKVSPHPIPSSTTKAPCLNTRTGRASAIYTFNQSGRVATAESKADERTNKVWCEPDGANIYRFTERELLRLQTVPDWYKYCGSWPDVKSITGNGWTVDVIRHILSFM